MSDSGRNRLLLKPWLESKIESGNYPGLCWLDRNQKIFRIPWIRNGTSSWRQETSAIFREWAIHTGKFQEGDKEDYPTWKTQLRNALNKQSEIIEQKTNTVNGHDPYKVYQMIYKPTLDGLLPTQENVVEMTDDFKLPNDIDPFILNAQSNFENVINIKEILHNSDGMPGSGSMDSDLKKMNLEDFLTMSSVEFEKFRTDFEVSIRLQSEQLDKISVKDCCFLTTYDPEIKPDDCQVIKLPEISPLTEEIRAITSVLWPSMKDGIYIKVDENKNIFAKRLCVCRIYCRDQNGNTGIKLPRFDGKTWTMIFSYQDFMEKYQWGDPNIQADVTLYIGQKGSSNPFNVFFSVTICHLLAKQSLTDRNIRYNKISLSIG